MICIFIINYIIMVNHILMVIYLLFHTRKYKDLTHIWWYPKTFDIWQCEQFVVIRDRVQVLYPFWVNISIKGDPLMLVDLKMDMVNDSDGKNISSLLTCIQLINKIFIARTSWWHVPIENRSKRNYYYYYYYYILKYTFYLLKCANKNAVLEHHI